MKIIINLINTGLNIGLENPCTDTSAWHFYAGHQLVYTLHWDCIPFLNLQ